MMPSTLRRGKWMEMEALEALSYVQSLGLKVSDSAKESAERHNNKTLGSKGGKRRSQQPLVDPGIPFVSTARTYLTVSGADAAASRSNPNAPMSISGGAKDRKPRGAKSGNAAGQSFGQKPMQRQRRRQAQ